MLTAETGSLGVRGRSLERWPAARVEERVDVDGLPVRVKVSPGRIKVEHDDAARVARRTGRPLRSVLSLAEESARRRGEGGPRGAVEPTGVAHHHHDHDASGEPFDDREPS